MRPSSLSAQPAGAKSDTPRLRRKQEGLLVQATHVFVTCPSKLMSARAYELLFEEYFDHLSDADKFIVASTLCSAACPSSNVRRALALADLPVAINALSSSNWLNEDICLEVLDAGPDLKRTLILDHQATSKRIIRWTVEEGSDIAFRHMLASRNVLFSPATQKLVAPRASANDTTTNLFLSRGDCNAEALLPFLQTSAKSRRPQQYRLDRSLRLGLSASRPAAVAPARQPTAPSDSETAMAAAPGAVSTPQSPLSRALVIRPHDAAPSKRSTPLQAIDRRVAEANDVQHFARSVVTGDKRSAKMAAGRLLDLNTDQVDRIFADHDGDLAVLMLQSMRLSEAERRLVAHRLFRLCGVDIDNVAALLDKLTDRSQKAAMLALRDGIDAPEPQKPAVQHAPGQSRRTLGPLTKQDILASLRTLPSQNELLKSRG